MLLQVQYKTVVVIDFEFIVVNTWSLSYDIELLF